MTELRTQESWRLPEQSDLNVHLLGTLAYSAPLISVVLLTEHAVEVEPGHVRHVGARRHLYVSPLDVILHLSTSDEGAHETLLLLSLHLFGLLNRYRKPLDGFVCQSGRDR